MATVVVNVVGNARSAVAALDSTAAAAGRLNTAGSRVGRVLKRATFAAATAGAIALGYALKTGFQRLSGIDNAQAKMRGLGHSTASVEKIMKSALGSVKGTAFSLDEAAGVAASAVAAGIKPGAQLDAVLKTVANSSAAAGTSMGEMGGIFTKVASVGKAQNDSLRQVADRGIPIYQELADQLGVTTEEVFKMASAGQIGFDQFEKAMASATGATADELGKTATGAVMNFRAAVARLGAALLGGVFPHLAPIFTALSAQIDKATDAVGPLAHAIGNALGGAVAAAVQWINRLDMAAILDKTGRAAAGVVQWLRSIDTAPLKDAATGSAVDNLRRALANLGTALAQTGPALGQVLGQAATLAVKALTLLANALTFVAKHSGTLVKLVPVIAAGFVLWQGAAAALRGHMVALRTVEAAMIPVALANQLVRRANIQLEIQLAAATGTNVAAQNASMLTTIRGTAALVAQRVAQMASVAAMAAVRAATVAWTAAQWLLNAALTANPIGLVVAAVAALVAGVVLAYTKIGWFRDAVNTAWSVIKSATLAVWSWVKTFIPQAWDFIINFVKTYHPVGIIASHWSQIKAAAAAAWSWVKNKVSSLWSGLVRLFKTYHPVGIIASHWSQIKAGVSSWWNSIRNTAANLWRRVVSVFRSGSPVAVVRNIWVAVRNAFVRGVNNSVAAARSLPSRLRSIFFGLGGMLVNSGWNLIIGFTRGINRAASHAVNAARNVVRRVRNLFPFSPAKDGPLSGRGYTTYSGKALAVDFASAIQAQEGQVKTAAQRIAAAARLDSDYDVSPVSIAPRRASGTSTGGLTIERGAITVETLTGNGKEIGAEIVKALEEYARRRGKVFAL